MREQLLEARAIAGALAELGVVQVTLASDGEELEVRARETDLPTLLVEHARHEDATLRAGDVLLRVLRGRWVVQSGSPALVESINRAQTLLRSLEDPAG